jgi:hypothetical protein
MKLRSWPPSNPSFNGRDQLGAKQGECMPERKPRFDHGDRKLRSVVFEAAMVPGTETIALSASFVVSGREDSGDPIEIDFNFRSNNNNRPHTYLSIYATKIDYGEDSRVYTCEGLLPDIQPDEVISMTLVLWFYDNT